MASEENKLNNGNTEILHSHQSSCKKFPSFKMCIWSCNKETSQVFCRSLKSTTTACGIPSYAMS